MIVDRQYLDVCFAINEFKSMDVSGTFLLICSREGRQRSWRNMFADLRYDFNDKESSSVITKKGTGKTAENKRYGTLTLIWRRPYLKWVLLDMRSMHRRQ